MCKKSLSEENFRIRKDGQCRYLDYRCRECEKSKAAEYRIQPGYYEHRKIYKKNKSKDIKFHIQEKISQWRKKTPHSNLETDYLVDLFNNQNGLCYYTNAPMIIGGDRSKELNDFLSLDKLDPIKGYMKGNVVWCTYLVNTVKQSMNETEFYSFLELILKIKNDRIFI